MVEVDVHVSSHLKKELAWATDKEPQVIIVLAIMLFKKQL